MDHLKHRANLGQLAADTFAGPSNSITQTLATRIAKLSWTFSASGRAQDAIGSFDLFALGWAEIHWRAEFAWPGVVASQIHHRAGFNGLQWVDAAHTRRWLGSLNVIDQGAYRKLLNGAHLTQDAKQHCQAGGSSLCPYCDCSDSRFHRFWICSAFEDIRAKVAPDILRLVPSLPEAISAYGWSLRPHTALAWLQYLDSLPGFNEVYPLVLPPAGEVVHLFTDGSCFDQAERWIRRGAWSVVLATWDDTCPLTDTWYVAHPLPGIIQSSYRAELYAVRVALQIVHHIQRAAHIWLDCEAVFRQLTFLQQGGHLKSCHPHADLWKPIQALLHSIPPDWVQFTLVASHVDPATGDCPLESWAFWFNSLADDAAQTSNTHRPQPFAPLFAKHASAVRAAHTISRAVQQHLLAVSKQVLKLADSAKQPEEPVDQPALPSQPLPTWTDLPPLQFLPSGAIRWYGFNLVQLICSWFWESLHPPVASTMQWISHFQLYIDFQLKTGHAGPYHDQAKNRWVDPGDSATTGLRQEPFKLRARWFAKVLKEILRHMALVQVYGFCRPSSRYLNLHASCIALPWSQQRLDDVDNWLRTHLVGAASRDGASLQSLPLADRLRSWPDLILVDIPVRWLRPRRTRRDSTRRGRNQRATKSDGFKPFETESICNPKQAWKKAMYV